MPENEKKSLLTGAFNASVVYDLKVQKHFVPQRQDIVQNFFLIYFHFDTKNYAWRLDKAQNFSCLILGHFVSKYILKNV